MDTVIIYGSSMEVTFHKTNSNLIRYLAFLNTKLGFLYGPHCLATPLVIPRCRCQPQACTDTGVIRRTVGAVGVVGLNVPEAVMVGCKRELGNA